MSSAHRVLKYYEKAFYGYRPCDASFEDVKDVL
jgi:hypothetical protein